MSRCAYAEFVETCGHCFGMEDIAMTQAVAAPVLHVSLPTMMSTSTTTTTPSDSPPDEEDRQNKD